LFDVDDVLDRDNTRGGVIPLYRALKGVVSVGRIHHKHTVARHIGQLRSNRQRNNRQTRKREELRIDVDRRRRAGVVTVAKSRRSRHTRRSRGSDSSQRSKMYVFYDCPRIVDTRIQIQGITLGTQSTVYSQSILVVNHRLSVVLYAKLRGRRIISPNRTARDSTFNHV